MEKLSLREFIDRREGEIKQLLLALRQELKELKAAKSAIDGEKSVGRPPLDEEAAVAPTQTIKSMALHVLRSRVSGGSTDQVIAWIAAEFGKTIERSSLSPQLSRLKSEGSLDLDKSTGAWRLKGEGEITQDATQRLDFGADASNDVFN